MKELEPLRPLSPLAPPAGCGPACGPSCGGPEGQAPKADDGPC